MARRTLCITIPTYVPDAQLGSTLAQVGNKARFVIAKSGKLTALLSGATDFDDMLEELETEFHKSLNVAAKEYRARKAISLRDYLRKRVVARHCLSRREKIYQR